MIYSSKEIIDLAKELAQVQNSKAFSFHLLTSLLNNCYSKLYNDLTSYTNSFIDYFSFTTKESWLPADCNKVLAVYYDYPNDNNHYLSQSSMNELIYGTYYLENNKIKIVGKTDGRKITVKYSKLPATLTAPDNPEKLNVNVGYGYGKCTEDGFYYQLQPAGTVYFYDFEKMEGEATELTTLPAQTNIFYGKALTYTGTDILWGTEVVTDRFIRPNHDSLDLVNAITDGYKVLIQYGDGEVWIMLGDWSLVRLNIEEYKGRKFELSPNVGNFIKGICSDDSTGDYIIYTKDGINYKSSFVPDTILDYPDQVFFDILIDMLAIQLQSLQGLNNDALQTKLQSDEESFFGSLEKSQQGMRIRNDERRGRGYWL